MATKKQPLSSRIREYQAAHPKATAKEIAAKFKTTAGYIYAIRNVDKRKPIMIDMTQHADGTITEKVTEIPREWLQSETDNVNHPAHYKAGGVETIDFIEAKGLNYHLGNVVKYITRADHKGNRKEDLLKAQWYLNREIARL
jgi:hypothetical protein